jgi:hypothetical protein
MAFYLLQARPKRDTLPDLEALLASDGLADVQPFGPTMAHSLTHARVDGDGTAWWEEECYCTPFLKEERAHTLDKHFNAMDAEVVEEGAAWARIAKLPYLFPGLSR